MSLMNRIANKRGPVMIKKIVFFHPYFSYGGVEKTNIRLAKFLIQKGYKVDFLVLSCTDHLMSYMEEIGINIIVLKANRTITSIYYIRKYLSKESKRYKTTFISCQNFANIIAIVSLFLYRKNIKLIISERNHPVEFEFRGKSIKSAAIMFLMKRLYRFSDVIVANSRETAEDLENIIGKRVEYIYNPTLTENYKKLSMEKITKEWFYEDIPIIISVGRLSKQKDFPTLIKAFKDVNNNLHCRLVILGEGEKRQELENLVRQLNIQDRVWMPGYEPNPYKYIKKSNVFVLSSLYEGLPNALIEALALKIACVSTDCKSGPKEILLNGSGGKLVNVSNYLEMSKAIQDIIKYPDEAMQMTERAYNQLYRFTPSQVGNRYIEVIEQ